MIPLIVERIKNWFIFHNSWFLSFLKNLYSFLINLYLISKETVTLPAGRLTVYILFDRYLGIGDLIMISPLLKVISGKYECVLVTHWPNIFALPINVIDPDKFSSIIKNETRYSSIIVSPTTNARHTRYLFNQQFFCGFFTDNVFYCNFDHNITSRFDSRHEHYRDRIFPILKAFNFSLVEQLSYPDLKAKHYDVGIKKYFVVAPFLRSAERRWPRERFCDLIYFLRREYPEVAIVIVGSGSALEVFYNQSFDNTVNLTGKTSILELISIIDGAIAFFGTDSGPAHISYLCNCKSFVVFGAVSPEHRLPVGIKGNHMLYNSDICTLFPCWDTSNRNECKHSDKYECIVSISTADMIKLILNKLSVFE